MVGVMAEGNVRSCIVGHRGAGNSAPGSTMAALEKAVELDLKWVEFDVRLTADHHLVIANADDLSGCSGQDIKISESTLDDLLDVDVAQSFVGTDDVHRIPLFEDAVAFCTEHGIRTQIELKGEVGTEEALAEAVVHSLKQQPFPAGGAPLITSFTPKCLSAIDRFSEGSLDTGLLIHTHLSNDWKEVAKEADPDYVHFYGGVVNNEHLADKFGQAVRDAGYRLNAYKVNTKEDAQAAIDAGAERFTSDEPEILLG
ncbi:MAG: hypothetical protein COB36_08780 [Alphaproteobacteria bacterium]|nr:MAG: hypothetical protein COB36_08780 [Alphaproteobacteria bacterium]